MPPESAISPASRTSARLARSAPWRVIDPIAVRFACGGTVAERAGSESERDAAAQLSRGDVASWRADMGHVEDMRRQ